MRNKLLIAFSLFVLCGLFSQLSAQAIKVKREAMDPTRVKLSVQTSTMQLYTGLRVFALGSRAYMSLDTTGSGTVVSTFSWTLTEKPAGSLSSLVALNDSVVKWGTTFQADKLGRYIVSISVNGGVKTSADTFWVNTYMGSYLPFSQGVSCFMCHSTNYESYKTTGHAVLMTEGIMGMLEANAYGYGTYGTVCFRCHTTGYDKTAANGNFGYAAKTTGFDTLWYKTYSNVNGTATIPYGDSTAVKLLNKPEHTSVLRMGNIGCESCHGAGNEHMGDKTKTAKSVDAGVCLQCHGAGGKHLIGSLWKASSHSNLRLSAGEASRNTCWPCHNGEAFVAYANNKTTPDYSKVTNFPSIACATCHDPHSAANENSLRTVRLDSLANGYRVPSFIGGKGQLCMNCHRARDNSAKKVAAQQVKFSDRFYPHYSPQADMYNGANAIEYGMNIKGIGTHLGLPNGCVTCHMSNIKIGTASHSNHTMNMAGQDSVMVKTCQGCHGVMITKYSDVIAAADYDGNGFIEGAQTEITGLLTKLRAALPKDATGEPVNMAKDSMLVKNDRNYPANLGAIFNYYFVKNDWSIGIHNTKYAAAILRASLSLVTGVEMSDPEIPKSFEISQNYPNPFNPSTQIKFSVPVTSKVTISIFNTNGQLVKTLTDAEVNSGNYNVTWNGDDQNNSKVASGVYFYRINASNPQGKNFMVTKKMMLLK